MIENSFLLKNFSLTEQMRYSEYMSPWYVHQLGPLLKKSVFGERKETFAL
jgi:hypothetical protein